MNQSSWAEDTNYSLIKGIFEAEKHLQQSSPQAAAFDQRTLAQTCRTLQLCPSEHDDLSQSHRWDVASIGLEAIENLPTRLPHAGHFDSSSQRSHRPPKWLWDSVSNETIAATDVVLQEGYIAISYTWGRWKSGAEKMDGTDWNVPTTANCGFEIRQLKNIMTLLKTSRFFWVDVLCINQGDAEETRQEIAKQGDIFAAAKGVYVYLWTIPTGDALSLAIYSLGDCLLYWSRLCSAHEYESPNCTGQILDVSNEIYSTALRADHWFSSLWTLQEMILAPASQWLTRDGGSCKLNGCFVTTHHIASAIFLLSKLPPMRKRLLNRMARAYSGYSEIAWMQHVRNLDDEGFGTLQSWVQWGLRGASIGSCLSVSRAAILLAGSRRQAKRNRGIAIIAALKIDYDETFEDGVGSQASNMPIALITATMQAEGASLFACLHGSEILSSMLPTTADGTHLINRHDFDILPCEGTSAEWQVLLDGSVVIQKGTIMQKMKSGKVQLYFNGVQAPVSADAANAKAAVAEHMGHKDINVKFLPIALRRHGTVIPPGFAHMLFEACQGVVLVASKDKPPPNMEIRWHKVGMFNATHFVSYRLSYQIVVRGA